jgi:hypothetical protein
MHRPFLLTICLVVVPLARADVPPPGCKAIAPRVRFQGVDHYPDYIFILKYKSDPQPRIPWHYHEVNSTRPFTMVPGDRICYTQLFAVSRTEAAQLLQSDPTMDWLNDKTLGLLRANVKPPRGWIETHRREVTFTTYRVTINDSELTVDWLKEVELLPDEIEEGTAVAHKRRESRLTTVVVSAVSGLSLVFLGIWLVRRRRSSAT